MIVVDGDSVALATRASVYPHQTWWGMLPDKSIILATAQATMQHCLERLPHAIGANPDYYILMCGQWAHNHEPLQDFAKYLNEILTQMTKEGIKVILVTPIFTAKTFDGYDVVPFVDAIRAAAAKFEGSGVRIVDLYKAIQDFDMLDQFGLHLGVAGNRLLCDHVSSMISDQ